MCNVVNSTASNHILVATLDPHLCGKAMEYEFLLLTLDHR